MINLSDLPEELQNAIYIEDCHISGEHDPTHTTRYVCKNQLMDLAKRVLISVGIDFDLIDNREIDKNIRVAELNKVPRKINRNGWYRYYRANSKKNADELDDWEKNGFK